MQLKRIVIPVTAAAVIGTMLVAPGQLYAATTNHHFIGFAGASAVKAVGSTVTSDLTSQSSVDTVSTGASSINTLATVSVPNILTSTNVTTSVKTVDVPGGVQIVSHSITSGSSLLGGAITVGAVDTINTTTVLDDANRTTSNTIHTTFVNLKIGSIKIPVNVPQNFHVTIPGVANVYLNSSFVGTGAPGSGGIFTFGTGLYVSLLKGVGASPLGTEVYLNPTYTAVETVTQEEGPLIGGNAYGSRITAAAGNLLSAESGPTAQISQPFAGTNGVNKTNSTVAVHLGTILNTGTLSNTANGVRSNPVPSYSTMSTQLAHVNLLNGLITADALSGQAHVGQVAGGGTESSTTTSLVNLVIAGNAIPVNVAPNTVITVGNLLKITIRKEVKGPVSAAVKVLEIIVTTASYGLPVGAVIEVGVARAGIFVG
ncbi:MAG: hypothetical protein QOC79_2918 [Actinomycetota bacterium]|nr:hypothetical protein [Actinomycetota bacterium]